jgi:hypothetical protein
MLGGKPVRTPLVARDGGRRLAAIAQAKGQGAALRISGIEAENQPGISWEVHVGPKGFAPGPRSLVGIFALFGAGLKTRANHYHPAEFVFAVGDALKGLDTAALEVIFVPVSGLEREPAATALQPRSPVRVGEIAIIVDAAMPQPPREEQERLRKQEESE